MKSLLQIRDEMSKLPGYKPGQSAEEFRRANPESALKAAQMLEENKDAFIGGLTNLMTSPFEAPNLEQTIARMKAEILADIANGTVPETCASFSELHDYVDANCYGGFADDEYLTKLWKFYGASSDDGCPAEVYEFTNNALMAINAWLEAGRPNG